MIGRFVFKKSAAVYRRLGFAFCETSKGAKTREALEPPYLELQRDFVEPSEFYQTLSQNGINFYTGVPDSLLKDFCGYVTDHTEPKNHIITANEGSAISVAAGYHLATGKIPCVYLQNSGLGNIVNPIMSMAHSKVYAIPMLLLIGWRGEPGKKDEPQHLVQGKCMNGMLTEMGIQFDVLPDYIEGAQECVSQAIYSMKNRKNPYALLVKRQCFTNYKLKNAAKNNCELTREQAMELIINKLGIHDAIVGTTGFLSRELFEYRKKRLQTGEQDFYCVGSMGYASSMALGIAIAKPTRKIYCFDGDGAAIMHMGAMTQMGTSKLENLKHIVFNNAAHDSVGAQQTVGFQIDFVKIAEGCGYKTSLRAEGKEDLELKMQELVQAKGPAFLEVRIRPGARKDLGRPTSTTLANKQKFMDFLSQ